MYLLATATAAEPRMIETSQHNTRYDHDQRMEWSVRRTTQRSDAIHLAMRQVSALLAAPVGGDWYDAFVQGGGHTLVIADVAGHDATAARAMNRLRRLLRRVAADVPHVAGPAELLTAVDTAMTTQGLGILTTGIVARLTALPDAHAWLLCWSNAGHPRRCWLRAMAASARWRRHRIDRSASEPTTPALRPSWSFNLERP
jgi:hypothetical protein